MTPDAHDTQAGIIPQARSGLRATHAIALVELVKGFFALLAASGLELLGPAPIQRFIHWLVELFRFDAHHSALATFARGIDPESVHVAASAAAAYGLLHLVEAWGLWRARRWASWLGCLSAAIYLPVEFYALFREPGWVPLIVVAINAAIVWILARDLVRRRPARADALAS